MLTHDQAIQAFFDEANELLGLLENALLELEHAPHNAEFIAEAFRALHTIKGPASMLGFEAIAGFTHEIETFFDAIRSGKLLLDAPLLALMLKAKDHIALLVSQGLTPSQQSVFASQELLFEIQQYVNQAQSLQDYAAQVSQPPASPEAAEEPSQTATPSQEPSADQTTGFRIRFTPASASLLTGANPLDLLEELSKLGALHCVFHADAIPSLEQLVPDSCHGSWDITLNTSADLEQIQDIFIFVEDAETIDIQQLDTGAVEATTEEPLPKPEPVPDKAAETTSRHEPEPVAVPEPAPSFQPQMPRPAAPPEEDKIEDPAPNVVHAASTSIRVDSARLDKLVNMVGEMVIIQSSLSQAASGPLDPTMISRIAEDLERLTDEMRENALGLRMLPIGTIYSNFKRLVHDLSNTLGKEVAFITEGAETELDKTVIDRLKDPLVHILRNCLDHGIEHPQLREDAGKPRTGRIFLASHHSGGDVVITIQDDGQGMDPVKIKEKALQLGLIAPETELDAKEIYELILTPGFSTAKEVSDVSGRGVGMDIVKRSIDDLRGRISIESAPGRGTTMTIRLPLTLAIIDGFNVVVDNESFIIPLANLRGFQERFVNGDFKTIQSIERMGELIPCVSLRRLFSVPGEQPDYERIIICDVEGTQIGLAVDNVIGRQQAVIKSLDSSLRSLKWISGTTINGDGSISLILDIPQLVRHASRLHN